MYHANSTKNGHLSTLTARHVAIVTPYMYAYASSYDIKLGRNKIVHFLFQPPSAKLISRQYYLPYGILLPLLCGRLTKIGMAGGRACRSSSLHCSSLDPVSESPIMLRVSYVHESFATSALGKLFW